MINISAETYGKNYVETIETKGTNSRLKGYH